ncbi:MAG TPA: hypothetical protein VGY57_06875 [Vicinamibacterales bacterium]|nr:hypothetical protein [Vicinamibacterales bacterium]
MKSRILTAAAIALIAAAALLAAQGPMQTVKNLQMTVKSVERVERASLRDCPPGTNTVSAVQRPGDEIAVVTVNFKVMPDFKPVMMKRPTVIASDDKAYNTSIQFVDVGSVPEYVCQFVYRVPAGTKLKTLQIEGASFDISALESK